MPAESTVTIRSSAYRTSTLSVFVRMELEPHRVRAGRKNRRERAAPIDERLVVGDDLFFADGIEAEQAQGDVMLQQGGRPDDWQVRSRHVQAALVRVVVD